MIITYIHNSEPNKVKLFDTEKAYRNNNLPFRTQEEYETWEFQHMKRDLKKGTLLMMRVENIKADQSGFEEITATEAFRSYCYGQSVYITTDRRKLWRLPASYEFGSHAPVSELFFRCVPDNEGEVKYFKIKEEWTK